LKKKTVSHVSTAAIILSLNNASQVFGDLLKNPNGASLALVREQPETALACLQSLDSIAMTDGDAAKVLDVIIGEQKDERAKELLRDHLTVERLRELLVARGDLDSTAAFLADPETIALAIAESATDNIDSLRRWAFKLKDRSDYAEVLKVDFRERSFLQWIVISVDCHFRNDEEIPLATWEDLGIDWEVGQRTHRELANLGVIPIEADQAENQLEGDIDWDEDEDEDEDEEQCAPPASVAPNKPADKHDDATDEKENAVNEIDL